MLNGLGDANADRAGVIAITGQMDESKIGTHTNQYLQQQLAVSPTASFSELLAHPDAMPYPRGRLPVALSWGVKRIYGVISPDRASISLR